MYDPSHVVLTIGLALWVGVMALTLARKLKMPPLLFYLLLGIGLGPMGLGWLHPETLGEGLPILVEFGLAIILFEGALSLPRTKSLPLSSRRLLGVGIPLTAVLSTIAARYIAGFEWLPAIAFGALIVVTGPTTIGPLLRSVSVNRKLEGLLRNEAIWGDCLGILLASVILPFWVSQQPTSLFQVPLLLVEKAAISVLLGGAIGFVLGRWLLPAISKLGDRELPGMVALSFAIIAFSLSQVISPGSGPIASAVAGFVLAFQKTPCVREIRIFKGQIAYVFISMFFVLLAGLFDPRELSVELWPLVLTTLVLGIVVRPFSLFAAFYKTDLKVNDRFFASLIGPRGIIALATASFIVTQMPNDSMAYDVFALTFMVIFFSSSFATIFTKPLAKILKVHVPEYKTGIVILGITPFSKALASKLSGIVPVKLLDSDRIKVESTKIKGVDVAERNALEDDLYSEANEMGFWRVLAATPNDALNATILEHAEHTYGSDRVFRVVQNAESTMVRDTPHARRQVAFAPDFSISALGDPGRWKLRESDSPGEGRWPLVSLKGGGARICRAGVKGEGPYLVLEIDGGS